MASKVKNPDKFIWEDAVMYDKDGRRVDPKTGKPIGDDAYSAEIRRMVKKFNERRKNNNG